MARVQVFFLVISLLGCSSADTGSSDASRLDGLAASMAFYASFEDGLDAAFARDDRRVYSAPSYDQLADRGPWYWGADVKTAYDQGAAVHALSFSGALSQAVFYSAEGNAPWTDGGTLSVWIRPGEYSGEPLAIYGSDSGQPALSLALESDPPRLSVTVLQQTSTAILDAAQTDEWIHVVVSIAPEEATLYVNGDELAVVALETYSWAPEGSTIRLGVHYGGLMDELAIFDRPLTSDEVQMLRQTPNLPVSLMRREYK